MSGVEEEEGGEGGGKGQRYIVFFVICLIGYRYRSHWDGGRHHQWW